MTLRFIAYAAVFAASVAVGYASARPAAAATNVTVTFHAEPVHYNHRPPMRYYPRGYFSPKHYYHRRAPLIRWQWHKRDWHHYDRRHEFHHKRDRHDRGWRDDRRRRGWHDDNHRKRDRRNHRDGRRGRH